MREIKDEEFESVTKNSKTPVLVDFWAPWCGPCRQLAPVLEEIAVELGSKVEIVKVNVDESPLAPAQFNVRGIPTLVLFKDSKMVDVKVGSLGKSQIIEWIESKI